MRNSCREVGGRAAIRIALRYLAGNFRSFIACAYKERGRKELWKFRRSWNLNSRVFGEVEGGEKMFDIAFGGTRVTL